MLNSLACILIAFLSGFDITINPGIENGQPKLKMIEYFIIHLLLLGKLHVQSMLTKMYVHCTIYIVRTLYIHPPQHLVFFCLFADKSAELVMCGPTFSAIFSYNLSH